MNYYMYSNVRDKEGFVKVKEWLKKKRKQRYFRSQLSIEKCFYFAKIILRMEENLFSTSSL
jgi:hypothetical protein